MKISMVPSLEELETLMRGHQAAFAAGKNHPKLSVTENKNHASLVRVA